MTQSIGGGDPPSLNGYVSGNCTWWVKHLLTWVPNGWGNAADWWSSSTRSGFGRSSRPVEGSVAVWGPGIDPPKGFGHVAVVESVRPDGSFSVTEMNWQGLGKVDSRNVQASDPNLLGFILPPGQSAGQQPGGSDPFGLGSAIQASTGQILQGAQVAGGAVLVLAGIALAVVLVARPGAAAGLGAALRA